MHQLTYVLRWTLSVALVTITIAAVQLAGAQTADPPRPPSLKTIAVPEPANLADFVKDRAAAIALGKALFWDMRVGSDGVTACATCHFNGGADSRSVNQVSPGLKIVSPAGTPAPDLTFNIAPGSQLRASDFPFRRLADANNRASLPLFDSNDVVSSEGVRAARFLQVTPGARADRTVSVPDPTGFRVHGVNVRRVEMRNTPTVINAVFNFRNFWDGRAQNDFNGVNNWGARDANAQVYRATTATLVEPIHVSLANSSLASQAVAPPLDDFEMSASGRPFAMIGRKLLTARPLSSQKVSPEDSVLGAYSRWPEKGLNVRSYAYMIGAAFQPQWWNSQRLIQVTQNGVTRVVDRADMDPATQEYSMLEYNFSLFFGLALQMYEATLVSNDTPYDRFMSGDPAAVDDAVIRGVDAFRSQARGRCINCHEGAELTGASVTRVTASPVRIREGQALDRGFNNIGVRPSYEDLGVGDSDPFGNPLANVRRLATPPLCGGVPCPIVADGFLKVPGLRNVALTAPYFHNGGTLNLSGVLEFYSRGGDYGKLEQLNGLGIAPLNVLLNTDQEKSDVLAFLNALTDERVVSRKAPFDHPQLLVPVGQQAGADDLDDLDLLLEIPAVGRNGGAPLKGFLQ